MRRRDVARRTAWQVFRWPLVMAVANIVGIVAALVGNGPYDILSWAVLGGTLVLMVLAWRGWSVS